MGEMITKPDANPLLVASCNLLLAGGVGYFVLGQKQKAMIAIVICLSTQWCCGLGWVFRLVFACDAYLLAQKLQSGESIGENENALEFLNMIFKD